MDANVSWKEGMSFAGSADTGFVVPLGAEPEVGGANDGFHPIELMAVSLAGCTAMDVISILTKKQQLVRAFEVQVHTTQAEEFPKVFTHAVITYRVTGHGVDESALRRSIELSATKYCPAHAMLGKVVPMEFHYEIFEGENADDRTPVKTGIFTL